MKELLKRLDAKKDKKEVYNLKSNKTLKNCIFNPNKQALVDLLLTPHYAIYISMKYINRIAFFSMLVFIFLFNSCASTANIPADLSPAQLIQRGQEASDKNRYRQSLQYYAAVIERYPTHIDYVIAAEYEIALIHYKQRRFDQARNEFNAILAHYDTPERELLPPQFEILSKIVLERIDARQTRRRRR